MAEFYKQRVVQELEIWTELTLYLDKTKDLKRIQAKAEEHARANRWKLDNDEETIVQPFQISLALDLIIITDYSGRFVDMIIQEPNIAEEFLRRYIHKCYTAVTDWRIDLALIQIKIQLSSLVEPAIKSINKFGLFNVRGILVSRTSPIKYVESTIFACPTQMCLGSKGERVSDLSIIPECDHCGNQCREVTKARVSGERVFGVMMTVDYLDVTQRDKFRNQGFVVEFPDFFHDKMVLGVEYNVIIKKDFKGSVCWGLHPLVSKTHQLITANPLPKSVMLLVDEIRTRFGNSPWALANFLSTLVSPNLIPDTTSIHLKTGILLSLISLGAKRPINVLGLGNCGDVMFEASKLAKRTLRPTLKLCTSPEGTFETADSYNLYQAGPLLLASSGVLYLGNMPKIGSPLYEQIAKAVESEKVILRAKDNVHMNPEWMSFPMRAAVWMHSECTPRTMQRLKAAIQTFGMPFFGESETDVATNMERLLSEASTPNRGHRQALSLSDFRMFLDLVSNRHVEISREASGVIRNYFVASRRERLECLPVNANFRTQLSESHAKLSLKTIVEYEDAIAAIFLYEESAYAFFDHKLVSLRPRRMCNNYDSPWEYVADMDRTLERFGHWLKDYIRKLVSCETSGIFTESE